MVLCGVGIMFCYDFLRIRRRICNVPDFWVNIEDFVFAVLSAVVVFYITYLKNNGEIRWQTAAGLVLGIGLYLFIIKDRFVKAVCKVWHIVVKITVKTVTLLLTPFIVILKILLKPARVVFWYSGRGIKKAGRSIKIKGAKAKIRLKHMGYIVRKK